MAPVPKVRTDILLHGEQSAGHVSMMEMVVPARSAGPPLHTHDCDEAFYMLEGELIFQVEDRLCTKRAGEFSFAPRNVAHALANHSDEDARYLLVCTPAGLERQFARMTRLAGPRTAGVGAAAHPGGHRGRPADISEWVTAHRPPSTSSRWRTSARGAPRAAQETLRGVPGCPPVFRLPRACGGGGGVRYSRHGRLAGRVPRWRRDGRRPLGGGRPERPAALPPPHHGACRHRAARVVLQPHARRCVVAAATSPVRPALRGPVRVG